MRTKYASLMCGLIAATLSMTTVANAATFNFVDLANAQAVEQGYQPYSTSDDGITITASGRSFDGASNYYAYLDKTDGSGDAGLGVCKTSNCNGLDDDNVTLNELLQLKFSDLVTITSITFRDGGHGTTFDGNAGYAIDSEGTTSLLDFTGFAPGAGLSGLEGTSFQFISGSTFQGITSEGHSLRLYISSITVELVDDQPPVPEPGTIGLLGLGLVALGARYRRRKK